MNRAKAPGPKERDSFFFALYPSKWFAALIYFYLFTLALPGGQFAQKSAIIATFGATRFFRQMRTGD
jgi:hypothetical protein